MRQVVCLPENSEDGRGGSKLGLDVIVKCFSGEVELNVIEDGHSLSDHLLLGFFGWRAHKSLSKEASNAAWEIFMSLDLE